MNKHRQRVLDSLNHQEPDRIPIDLGATPTSGIHVSCVAALREHFRLEAKPVKVIESYQMLGEVDEELREHLGVDVVGIPSRMSMFGFENSGEQLWQTPWGQEVIVPSAFHTTTDANNDILIYPQGDTKANASGKMPHDSYFFDTIIRQSEPDLDLDDADPMDNCEEFGLISNTDLDYFEQGISEAEQSGCAIAACIPGTALGDIALVPAPFMKQPKGLRDISEWYMGIISNPEYIEHIFAYQVDIALQNLEKIFERIGNRLDVAFLCGTDFGTQIGTFCSRDTFDEVWLPYYKKITGWIHQHTTWKTFKHSCGAVAEFIPNFIEAGFDILNPVQCSAAGMDPRKLKEQYGDGIVFWGGAIDTQHCLPFGSPDEVRQQTLDRCEIFSKNGGFVFNSIHNIQARTPIENIVAYFEAVQEFHTAGV